MHELFEKLVYLVKRRRLNFGFLLFLGLLLIGIFHVYFPSHSISITSNDQLDSFFPYFEVLPSVFQSIFDLEYVMPRNLSGVTLNSIGMTEFDMARIIGTIFPTYVEISIFYLVYLNALFISSFLLYRQFFLISFAKLELTAKNYVFCGFAAFWVTILPHNAFVLGPIIGLNFFALGAMKAFTPGHTKIMIFYFVLSGLFGRFALGGYFYIPACTVLGFLFLINRPDKARIFVNIIIGLCIVTIADYRLFAEIISPASVSHRANWLDGQTYTWMSLISTQKWMGAFDLSKSVIVGDTPHFHYQWNTHNYFIKVVLVILGVHLTLKAYHLIVARPRAIWFNAKERVAFIQLQLSLGATLIVLMGYGILRGGVLNLSIISGQPFQFERVIVALPMLSGAIILSCLNLVGSNPRIKFDKAGYSIALIITGIFIAFQVHEPLQRKTMNLNHFKVAGSDNPFIPKYTVSTRYNHEGYQAVKDFLGEAWYDERTITVGADAMATAYNGFATVDGYFPNYPETYQQDFLSIISPAFGEIGKKRENYYSVWGNRLKIPIISRNSDKTYTVKIDGCALSDLNGTLVLSDRAIRDFESSSLKYITKIDSVNRGLKSTFWLYRPSATACED